MRVPLTLAIALSATTLASCANPALEPFEFPFDVTRSVCDFSEAALPADLAIYAAGAYRGREIGFQIDTSGREATQIDVAVNSPDRPVALMLGAYETTIWNIGWTPGTRILAVVVSGHHRQALAGLDKRIPRLISSGDVGMQCGTFHTGYGDSQDRLDPMAKRIFGRGVDGVFKAGNGRVVVGNPLPYGAKLLTSPHTPVSFYTGNQPLAGPAALEEAVRRGILRRVTAADAAAWANAVEEGAPRIPWPSRNNAYVVLKPFTYPPGLSGSNSPTLVIAEGVPLPQGIGTFTIYDFNKLRCYGLMCGVQ